MQKLRKKVSSNLLSCGGRVGERKTVLSEEITYATSFTYVADLLTAAIMMHLSKDAEDLLPP
jgi:hypothetical protein